MALPVTFCPKPGQIVHMPPPDADLARANETIAHLREAIVTTDAANGTLRRQRDEAREQVARLQAERDEDRRLSNETIAYLRRQEIDVCRQRDEALKAATNMPKPGSSAADPIHRAIAVKPQGFPR